MRVLSRFEEAWE